MRELSQNWKVTRKPKKFHIAKLRRDILRAPLKKWERESFLYELWIVSRRK